MSEHYPLPMGSKEHWKPDPDITISNFNLRFHRFQAYPYMWNFKNSSGADQKSDVWKKILEDGNIACQNDEILSFLNRLRENNRLTASSFRPSGMREISLKLASSMSLGSSESSALETGILLHPLYGVPYIPSSSIKGVLRNRMFTTLADKWNIYFSSLDELIAARKNRRMTAVNIFESYLMLENPHIMKEDEISRLDDQWLEFCIEQGWEDNVDWREVWKSAKLYRYCFSPQKNHEKLIFFDAFPDPGEKPVNLFALDIINPHYSEYYSSNENPLPPADYLSPIPNKFLVVRKGISFVFQINCKKEKFADILLSELKDCLCENGIGSKTSLGYGLFSE